MPSGAGSSCAPAGRPQDSPSDPPDQTPEGLAAIDTVDPDLWWRYFVIALQGLRPQGAPLEPLPAPPLPPERMEELLVVQWNSRRSGRHNGQVEAVRRDQSRRRFGSGLDTGGDTALLGNLAATETPLNYESIRWHASSSRGPQTVSDGRLRRRCVRLLLQVDRLQEACKHSVCRVLAIRAKQNA